MATHFVWAVFTRRVISNAAMGPADSPDSVFDHLPIAAAPPASDHDEAIKQVAEVLNQVEDDMTSSPTTPCSPRNDGRMYAPLPDSKRAVRGRPDVTRYRSKGHSTEIGNNRAIQINDHASGDVVFDKPGADGLCI
jgi:hypothetical protein